MRTLLTYILLATAVLAAVASKAQTVDICDRTAQVRDALLEALEADDCAAVDSEGLASVETLDLQSKQLTALQAGDFDSLTGLHTLSLEENQLTALPDGVFDGLTRLHTLSLWRNQLTALPDGVFDSLTSLHTLSLRETSLTTLPHGVFDSLTSLQDLSLGYNQLTMLPDGVFDGLTNLLYLFLDSNQLTALSDGVFDSLTNLRGLLLDGNQLTTLPDGVFDRLTDLIDLGLGHNPLTLPDGVFDALTNLQLLLLHGNEQLWILTTLPDGVFDGLTSLEILVLSGNQLTSLRAGLFDDLTSLRQLFLWRNQLTTLPDGLFDSLTSLQELVLNDNRLTALSAGVFDSLTSLQELSLRGNRLTTFPEGVFDSLTSLRILDLRNNYLVGLTRNDPLFAGLSSGVDIRLDGQTTLRLAAAVPLMLSTSDATRQGFVRLINESQESASVRVFAFDDSGYAPDPIDIPLGASQTLHFNSSDLENGNVDKGIAGIGSPVQGEWRLDVETVSAVRVMAFVRTGDGFLTAMHDVLPRDADGRLVAHIFNPGRNMNQESKLRLVNTGAFVASVAIEGVDDEGGNAGPVTLTLAAGEARTLSAFDLENGGNGLTGSLGGGAGKWRLFITAGHSVVGVSLLEAASGHLTNISTMGVIRE